MPASYAQDWQLGSSRYQSGTHRRGAGGDAPQMPDSTAAFQVAAAGTAAKASRDTAAMAVGSRLAEAGIGAQTELGVEALKSTALVASTAMNNAQQAYSTNKIADARIKEAKLAYGESPLDYVRMAGGGLLAAYAMGSDNA